MKKLLLFDVDGTICDFGQKITCDMLNVLDRLRKKYDLGVVGGGIYKKLCNQIPDIWKYFVYVCGDNGNDIYKHGKNIYRNDIRDKWGIDVITKINETLMLYLIKNKQIPIKTGKFINLRKGLIYFVPIGHDCTKDERRNFTKNDIRISIIQDLYVLLSPIVDVTIELGGELGIAIFPEGWGKKMVLNYIDADTYEEIVYFGDKICPHGNDLGIANDAHKYYKVNSYKDTLEILAKYF